MNIKSIFALSLSAVSLIAYNQQDQFTIDNYSFQGPIETIKTEHYSVPKPNKPGTFLYSMEYEFSRKGEVDEYTFEMDLGFIYLEGTTSYIRDERGWVIKEQYDNGDEKYTCTTYEYDEAGKITKIVDMNKKEDVLTTTIFEYDERGNLTLKDVDKENGGYDYKVEYEYDDQDRKTKYKYSSLSFKESIQYEYDDNDNIIVEKLKTQSSDSKGRPVHVSKTTKREFNGDNNCTVAIDYNDEGEVLVKRVYEYDGDGNKTMVTSYNAKGKVLNYTKYEGYDEHGNYKESYTFTKKKLSSYEMREIEYY